VELLQVLLVAAAAAAEAQREALAVRVAAVVVNLARLTAVQAVAVEYL
jgi:hypothetical protein